jgi:adenine-specific DNA-methyltransferase
LSRLNDLIRQVGLANETLAADLQREVSALADRRSFGLNFERHVPEVVELPGRPVRRGDKVRILPPRGQTPRQADEKLWQVAKIDRSAEIPVAELAALVDDGENATATVDDLVVVAEFRDPIYPGLVSTGNVERGGDKPFHTVINAENYHALQALLFTHRGKVDCIYIDPPYNTGAKDWKYNNDYVEGDDLYRHSKWLAFMERRLLLAKELLNPDDSVLIVTIDEKEYLRLGLLLEQTFPESDVQMVTTVTSPQGVARPGSFSRVNEFIYFVRVGAATVSRTNDDMLIEPEKAVDAPVWFSMIRSGTNARREDSKNGFYPIYVDSVSRRITDIGSPLPIGVDRASVEDRPGLQTVWPIRRDGSEGNWQLTANTLRASIDQGFVKVGERNPAGRWSIMYVRSGDRERLQAGDIIRTGRDAWGNWVFARTGSASASRIPKSVWNKLSHDAGKQGSMLTSRILSGGKFPFPKSLYAVEDALRFFVAPKPDAVVIDFFAGSGTTAHAVMRLNRQDGGQRRSICVTNNEVSAEQQRALRSKALRPGDPAWEEHGICDAITKPRIQSAITGISPDGDPIKGDYKFTDEFPMAEGFEENVEFFTLSYEAPLRVASHRDFERIAPLLWLRAGTRGRRIEDVTKGWDVAEAYGVLADLDEIEPFLKAVVEQDGLEIAFIVTDEDRLFESVVRELPEHVEPVRLYEAYLRNFEIESGRGLR